MSQYMNNEKKLNEATEVAAGAPWYAFFGSPEFLISATAVGGIIAAIKAIQSHTIKGRFQKCVKILYKMQKDFGTAEHGMDMKATLPGVGSGIVDWISRLFTFKGRNKDKNKGALGLRPFVDNYVNEINLDYQQALNAYNTVVIGSKMGKKAAANTDTTEAGTGEPAKAGTVESVKINNSTSKIYESFAAALADINLNESEKANIINEELFTNKFKIGKDGSLVLQGEKEEKRIAITTQSVREVCYAIFNLFFAKYFDLKSVFNKLGINDFEDIDEKNIDKFQQVAQLFANANSTSSKGTSKMYIRIQGNYKKMVAAYVRIGEKVINNFEVFSKKMATKNVEGGQLSEKDSNLLTASVEKLNAELQRQKDGYENNFNRVLLGIVSSPSYSKFIDFILTDVMNLFKKGIVDETMSPNVDDDALPNVNKEGSYILGKPEKLKVTTNDGKEEEREVRKIYKAKYEQYDEQLNQKEQDLNDKEEELKKREQQIIELEETAKAMLVDAETKLKQADSTSNSAEEVESQEINSDDIVNIVEPAEQDSTEAPKRKKYKMPRTKFLGALLSGFLRFVGGLPKPVVEKIEGEEVSAEDEHPTEDIKVFNKFVKKQGADIEQDLIIYLKRNETNEQRQNRLAAETAEEKPAEETEESQETNDNIESLNELDRGYALGQREIQNQREEDFRVVKISLVTGAGTANQSRVDVNINSELYYETLIKDLKLAKVIRNGETNDDEGAQAMFTEVTDESIVNSVIEKCKDIQATETKDAANAEEIKNAITPVKAVTRLANEVKNLGANVENAIVNKAKENGGSLYKEVAGDTEGQTKLECIVEKKPVINIARGDTAAVEEVEVLVIPTNIKTLDREEEIVVLVHPIATAKETAKPESVNDTPVTPKATEENTQVASVQEEEVQQSPEASANEQPKLQQQTPIAERYDFSYAVLFAVMDKERGAYRSNYDSKTQTGIKQVKAVNEIPNALAELIKYYNQQPGYLGESKFTIEYGDLFNLAESFMGTLTYLKVNRTITTDAKNKGQYYVLSENAWGDGVVANPEEYLKEFINNSVKTCNTYDDFTRLAKSSVSINFMPLSEDCSYKTRLPYNRYQMLTQSNPLYEATVIVSFDEEQKVKNTINLGISKIAK